MSTATVFNLRAKRARRSDLDYFEPFGFFQHSLPGRRDTQASHCTDISVCVFAFWQCYKILKRKSKGKEGEEEKNFNTAVYSVLISCLGFCGKLCVCVHFNIACLTGVSFAMHFCVLLQGFMFDWELSLNVLHVISFLYCARCSCETNLHICGVTALRCAFQVISVRLPLPLCMCARAWEIKAGLTVCCRAAVGQRAQINNHAVQTDVELASCYNRAFVLRLQHQTQLDVLH